MPMPEGPSYTPVTAGSGGSGQDIQTVRVTQWIVDPTTGVGAWVDTSMQVVVLADKRGDPLENEHLLDDTVAELRMIRELLEQLMLKLA